VELHGIYAGTLGENTAAVNLAERLGMRREGVSEKTGGSGAGGRVDVGDRTARRRPVTRPGAGRTALDLADAL
jgi:RimJ/RimL family protein N-acetyltransferase